MLLNVLYRGILRNLGIRTVSQSLKVSNLLIEISFDVEQKVLSLKAYYCCLSHKSNDSGKVDLMMPFLRKVQLTLKAP